MHCGAARRCEGVLEAARKRGELQCIDPLGNLLAAVHARLIDQLLVQPVLADASLRKSVPPTTNLHTHTIRAMPTC